jgi:V8-like Glu-specific endopeptidase
MLKLQVAAVAMFVSVSLAFTGSVSAQEQSVELSPRVMGGTLANGNPGAVALAIFDGRAWTGSCSAALWKSNLLITNAHCTTIEGTGQGASGFAVFPPGVTALRYTNFLQNQSALSVVNVWRADGYVNASTSVEPNDIAVMQLSGDLAQAPFTRIATTEELTRWTRERAVVDHVGYGLVGPGQFAFDPSQVSLPLVSFQPDSRLGSIFRTAQTTQQGICSGDSGSPVSRQDQAGNMLLGVVAGGGGPCVNGAQGTPNNVNVAAIGYLPLLNRALEATGRPTIPSAPQQIAGQPRNRSITVSWQLPVISPQTVVGYDVVNAAGAVACSTADTRCTVDGLVDGTYAFTVRARNSEGEGDAAAITSQMTATIASPQQLPAPFIRTRPSGTRLIAFTTLAGRTSAVVTNYVVTDAKGKRICRVVPTQAQQSAPTLTCPLPKQSGSYRFRVLANTEMGKTPASGLSKRVVIR